MPRFGSKARPAALRWHAAEDALLERLGADDIPSSCWEDIARRVSAVDGGGARTAMACERRFRLMLAAAPGISGIAGLVGVDQVA